MKETLDQATAEWAKANVADVKEMWHKFEREHGPENIARSFDKSLLQDIVKKAFSESADLLEDDEFSLNLFRTRHNEADGQPLFQFVKRGDFPKTLVAVGAGIGPNELFTEASVGQTNHDDPNLRLIVQLLLQTPEEF